MGRPLRWRLPLNRAAGRPFGLSFSQRGGSAAHTSLPASVIAYSPLSSSSNAAIAPATAAFASSRDDQCPTFSTSKPGEIAPSGLRDLSTRYLAAVDNRCSIGS